jgi:hypothetical protein
MMETSTLAAPHDDGVDGWSWLAGTYWYVPTPTLPAILLVNVRERRTVQVNDQTLWFIERSQSGYLIGQCAVSLNGGAFSYMTLVGSVTPKGDVCLSFAPVGAVSIDAGSGVEVASLTIGYGRLVERGGDRVFLMQMSSGSGAQSLSHWSYMLQSTPTDASWTDIPGVPGTSIGAVFDGSRPL